MTDIQTESRLFKGNWYRIVIIDNSPFIVICAQADFNKGRIQIFSALFYSVKEANQKFEDQRKQQLL